MKHVNNFNLIKVTYFVPGLNYTEQFHLDQGLVTSQIQAVVKHMSRKKTKSHDPWVVCLHILPNQSRASMSRMK
jgi:hypothetical protein